MVAGVSFRLVNWTCDPVGCAGTCAPLGEVARGVRGSQMTRAARMSAATTMAINGQGILLCGCSCCWILGWTSRSTICGRRGSSGVLGLVAMTKGMARRLAGVCRKAELERTAGLRSFCENEPAADEPRVTLIGAGLASPLIQG